MYVLWLTSPTLRVWDLSQSVPRGNLTWVTISFLCFKSQGMESLFPRFGLLPGRWSGAHSRGRMRRVQGRHAEKGLEAMTSRPQLTHLWVSTLNFRECSNSKQKWLENDVFQVFEFWENKWELLYVFKQNYVLSLPSIVWDLWRVTELKKVCKTSHSDQRKALGQKQPSVNPLSYNWNTCSPNSEHQCYGIQCWVSSLFLRLPGTDPRPHDRDEKETHQQVRGQGGERGK